MSEKIEKDVRMKTVKNRRLIRAFMISSNRSQRLIKNRRAVSVVVSNLIMIAAVIAVGFIVLAYTNSQSNSYVTQYGQTVSSDINKLRETVAFEYVNYNRPARNLTVYLINAGSINNVNVTSVTIKSNSISNSSWSVNIPVSTMHYLVNGATTKFLNAGQEGSVSVTVSLAKGSYKIQLTTWRGSIFEYTFDA